MSANTTNNRCPNCGAPLRDGQQAVDCGYCNTDTPTGTDTARVTAVPDNTPPVADREPPRTNALKYFLMCIALGVMGAALDEPSSNLDFVLMMFCFCFFVVFCLSLIKYGFARLRYNSRQND